MTEERDVSPIIRSYDQYNNKISHSLQFGARVNITVPLGFHFWIRSRSRDSVERVENYWRVPIVPDYISIVQDDRYAVSMSLRDHTQSVHICPWKIIFQRHIASGRNINKAEYSTLDASSRHLRESFTDGRTDGRTYPFIEMRGRVFKIDIWPIEHNKL